MTTLHTPLLTRRRFLQLTTVGATGVMLAALVGRAYAAPVQQGDLTRLQLNLPPYPFFANLQSVMTEDRPLLDRLLAAYERETPGATQHPIDFLSRYVPVYVFERTLRPTEPDDPALSTLLWLMHLAGYFGGVWLRTAFVNAGVPRDAFPVGEASFAAVVARINGALAAFTGDDAGALAYAEASLRGGNLQGLTDNFGYNAGYLDQIFTGAKPANVTAPAGYFTYNPADLFNGFYGVPEIKPLDNWRKQAENAAQRPGSRYAAIVQGAGGADTLPAIQLAGNGRGKFVWAPGNQFNLNISNFDQATYDLLLVTSAYFLQCVQATGLAALASAAVANADWARAAVRSNAMTIPYGGSYGVGLFDGAGQMPTFT
ncbi:MAG: hypothetical protein DYG89_35450 [Caldilinea sp. CFX5]|nr:hypothetical protein [Caldilinea sp. CFX5]